MKAKTLRVRVRERLVEPGKTCGFRDYLGLPCAHRRSAHKYDETDGSAWCDECWADRDVRLQQMSSHTFDEGIYANV